MPYVTARSRTDVGRGTLRVCSDCNAVNDEAANPDRCRVCLTPWSG